MAEPGMQYAGQDGSESSEGYEDHAPEKQEVPDF